MSTAPAPGGWRAAPLAAAALVPLAVVGVASLAGGLTIVLPLVVPGAIAAGLAGAAVLWAVARQPRRVLPGWSLVLLLAGTKFRDRDATDSLAGALDGQVMFELALYGLLIATLAVVVHASRLRLGRLGVAERLVLGYAALALVSTLWSETPALSAVRGVELCAIAAAAVVFTRLHTPDAVLRALRRALTAYVVVAAGLAATVPLADGTQTSEYDGVVRFSWFAVHPILAGTLAGLAIVLLAAPLLAPGAGRSGSRLRGLAAAAAIPALAAAAVATKSRGPLGACLAALVVAVLTLRLRPGTIVATAMAGGAAVLLAVASGFTVDRALAAAGQGGAIGALVLRNQDAEQVTSFSGRGELWAGVVQLIQDRPVLGHGYQGARAELLRIVPWAGHAHNAVLQSALDLGVAGGGLVVALFAFAVCVGSPFAARRRSLRVARATVLAVVVFEGLNAVTSETFAGAPNFETFLFLACVCLAARLRAADAPRLAAWRAAGLAGAAPLPPAPRLPWTGPAPALPPTGGARALAPIRRG